MQPSTSDWKPPREEKKINHQPIPMFQAFPPEAKADPSFEKHFQQAETGRLKDKVKGLQTEADKLEAKADEVERTEKKPSKRSDAHQKAIEHDDKHPEKFKQEFIELRRIYTVIRKQALEKLTDINDALLQVSRTQTAPDDVHKAALSAYKKATDNFEKFVTELDNPHVKNRDPNDEFRNGVTLKWATIQPKIVEGGYISGAKVIVRWAGGSHISSDSLP